MAVGLELLAVALQGASADVEAAQDHVMDACGLQKVRQILGSIVREGVAYCEDAEGVGIAGKRIVGVFFLCGKREGRDQPGEKDEDSFHIFLYLW